MKPSNKRAHVIADLQSALEDDLRTKQHQAKLEKQLRSERARINAYERSWHNRSLELADLRDPQLIARHERELEYISKQIDKAQAREADLQTELAALSEPTDTD